MKLANMMRIEAVVRDIRKGQRFDLYSSPKTIL